MSGGFDEQKRKALEVLNQLESSEDMTAGVAESIALVEYYYRVHITGGYPIMKRFNQVEHLMKAFDLDARRFGLKSD